MRKRIWKIHSWVGLASGLALVIIGLTGSVLVFHQEISTTLHPKATLNSVNASGEGRLPLSELSKTVDEKFPDYWIRGWLIRHDSPLRDKAYLMPRDGNEWHLLYVDPYTGETSERPLALNETLYGWFVNLHYTFFADHIGMAITGVFALGFLFLAISGIYLHRPFFGALFRFRWKASARILYSDIHKAIGVATIPFNLIFGFTGAYWNISHIAHEMFEHADEEEEAIASELASYRERLDALWATSEQTIPGFSLNYVYYATEQDPYFYLYGQSPGENPLRSPYGSNLWVSAETGEVTQFKDLRKAGVWAKIEDAFEPLHFGDFGGLFTKLLWCVAGFSPAALSISGSLIFIRRMRRKRPALEAASISALTTTRLRTHVCSDEL